MKELLRITHGMQDQAGEDALYDYNLEVYEGEILYIQGMPGNGIRTLMNIFAGDCALKSGKLLLNGKEVSGYNRDGAFLHGIYTITAERDLVEILTVAENLEAIRYGRAVRVNSDGGGGEHVPHRAQTEGKRRVGHLHQPPSGGVL